MKMLKISEAIVVEGRYDKNTLSQIVDAAIIETSGFAIFNDGEKLKLLRRLAEKRGLIILTDSDGAGFVIRNYLKGALPDGRVKHAYIPDIEGKERRKQKPSAEMKLGVEGMRKEAIIKALLRAGATFEAETVTVTAINGGGRKITKSDLYADGLSGGPESAHIRENLLKHMDLPGYLSSNALLEVLNALYSYEEYKNIVNYLSPS